MRSDTFVLSGAECAVALGELGLDIVGREPGKTILRSRKGLVVVPDVLELPAIVLDAILTSADISFSALLRAVTDETPTRTRLQTLAS
jgi:hypothetical protein